MSPTSPLIGELLAATVPMARTLDLEFTETTAERAVVRLPDRAEFRNHVGGPLAGAVFTLAESASGGRSCSAPSAISSKEPYRWPYVPRSPTPSWRWDH